MRLPVVIRQIGSILIINAVFLFISCLISLFNGENSVFPLLYSGLIVLIFGIFPLIFVPKFTHLSLLEGVVIIVFGWITTCIIGMLPYIMWGGEFTLINSWFESVSGYTTTGSTILHDIETLPKGLLFWRSSTHWIGGIGVIVFALLILPHPVVSKLVMVNSEISGIARSNFRTRVTHIVRILAAVYFGLTVLETFFLWLAGMSIFDAINHTFATVATGGFSTKNSSIAYFDSVAIEIIIMVFMVLSGLHFGLIYATISGKRENLFRSEIVRVFLLVLFAGVALVTLKLWTDGYGDLWSSLRLASFQVLSVGTTTGFATTDTASWPVFTILVLIYFTIQCACAGSTSGGLKFDRVLLFFKNILIQIKSMQHPRGVFQIRINRHVVEESVVNNAMVYILLYLFIIFITTLVISAMNVDLMTSFSASITTIGNVGPGFSQVSSLGNYSNLPSLAKFILSLNMLLGRLEIFSVISLFFLKSWK
ncbi:MAG: TrkH family potassium uptake protein [Sphingobacteriia bacterium]|nr:TrkH family potassium uptake protein [Sphingobacteriia bacterium]